MYCLNIPSGKNMIALLKFDNIINLENFVNCSKKIFSSF